MPVHQPTRRQLLRSAAAGAISAAAAELLAACTTPAPLPSPSTPDAAASAPTPSSSTGTSVPPTPSSRILLAYFSRPGENYWNGGRRTLDVGNTEGLAALISDRIDCDVHRIEAADPYSDRYDPTVARNVQEQDANARPAIANPLPDLTGYDTVLLGSPIWNVQPPMILATFTEGVDLTGKTLLPFVTYAVSGLGSTPTRCSRSLTRSECPAAPSTGISRTVTDAGYARFGRGNLPSWRHGRDRPTVTDRPQNHRSGVGRGC